MTETFRDRSDRYHAIISQFLKFHRVQESTLVIKIKVWTCRRITPL